MVYTALATQSSNFSVAFCNIMVTYSLGQPPTGTMTVLTALAYLLIIAEVYFHQISLMFVGNHRCSCSL